MENMEKTISQNGSGLNGKVQNTEPAQTYLNIGTPETGMLEIDLISFRQKNEEARYLSLSFTSMSKSGEDSEPVIFAIDNEEAFLTLKNFFTQLNWNS